jgi:hypothetical protein
MDLACFVSGLIFCQSPLIKGRVYLTTMDVMLLAASALIVQSGVLLAFYQLFCNCPMLSHPKSVVHKWAATGGTSKEIMSSILPLKRPTDYLNQGRTGSRYDKNAQLTLLSQLKLAFTGRSM